MTEAQSRCEAMRQTVFASCNAVVDPTRFIENCMFDFCLCNDEDREDCFCDSLATYAAACAAAGIPPSNWRRFYCRKYMNSACIAIYSYSYKYLLRESLFVDYVHQLKLEFNLFYIAIQCPTGMVFQQCGSLCPQTCGSSTTCNSGCAEGCFCPGGQVINSNGLCINPRECLGKKLVYVYVRMYK